MIDKAIKGKGNSNQSLKSTLKYLMMGSSKAVKDKSAFLKDFQKYLKRSVDGSMTTRASSRAVLRQTRRSRLASTGKDNQSKSVVNLSETQNDLLEHPAFIFKNQKPRSSLFQVQQTKEGPVVCMTPINNPMSRIDSYDSADQYENSPTDANSSSAEDNPGSLSAQHHNFKPNSKRIDA